MRVTVSVPGRFHGFDLARELAGAGASVRVLTTYPGFIARKFMDLPTMGAPWLEAARRLHQRFGLGPGSDDNLAPAFARFTARNLDPHGQVLVGWSNFTLEAIAPAHALGQLVVLERGSSHIEHQHAVLVGAGGAGVPESARARELAEYAACDAIMVPTGFAKDTFIAHGIDAAKVHVNPYGVALDAFRPADVPVARPLPRVLFVGRVGLRKGVPELIEAARLLAGKAEIVLIGGVEPGMKQALAAAPVTVRGALPGGALPAEYQAADIFALPSLEEGLPLVILQAMASGLPVVATAETGIADLLTDAGEAVIVPSRDAGALAEALAQLAVQPERRRAMGAAARRRVETGYCWGDYGARALALYAAILAGLEPALPL